ncbi:hypothetical protein F2P56_013781 [Juglans regia]|uniref:Uncharacterized protein n=1 Tax=Juglans regia TaxID=51240 RepID=A0A834CS91_JUGRE|nr:hypothetical protein F2P56_013781 [Juglans regia]
MAEAAPVVCRRSTGPRSLGEWIAAVAVQEPYRRSSAAEVLQEQGGLLPDPRVRCLLQQCVAAPEDGLVLGQAAGGSGRNGGPSGGGVDLVGGLGRIVHGHGVQAATGAVQGSQPRRARLGPLDLRRQELDGAERRCVPDQELSVVDGPHGGVGEHGSADTGIQEVGPNTEIDVQGQAVSRVGRSDGPDLLAVQREREMGGEGIFGGRILFRGILARDNRDDG